MTILCDIEDVIWTESFNHRELWKQVWHLSLDYHKQEDWNELVSSQLKLIPLYLNARPKPYDAFVNAFSNFIQYEELLKRTLLFRDLFQDFHCLNVGLLLQSLLDDWLVKGKQLFIHHFNVEVFIFNSDWNFFQLYLKFLLFLILLLLKLVKFLEV